LTLSPCRSNLLCKQPELPVHDIWQGGCTKYNGMHNVKDSCVHKRDNGNDKAHSQYIIPDKINYFDQYILLNLATYSKS